MPVLFATNRPAQFILVVDSLDVEQDRCAQLLSRQGYMVLKAADGEEGVRLAREQRPDLIVMEDTLPVKSGLSVTATLRAAEATADIPILLVTSEPTNEEITTCLEAGANDYLVRPVRPKELLLRIRRMLGLRHSQEVAQAQRRWLERSVRITATLHRFYEESLSADCAEATCRRTVETAASLTQSDRVSMLVMDPGRHCLRFAHAVGVDEQVWRDATIPITSPVAGRVLATNRPMVVNGSTFGLTTNGTYRTSCFMSFPVGTVRQGRPEPIGVLSVTHRRGGEPYPSEEIHALRELSQASAFAIEAIHTRRKLDATRESIIFSLARLSEFRHARTGKHLERVSELSVLLARQMAADASFAGVIDDQFVADLRRAAPLHDIGKVAIPDCILLKAGGLTPKEQQLIHEHSRIGAEGLRSVIAGGHDASFVQMAMDVAHYHHERYDGKGYPEGLAAEAIPLSARIVCLADSYDAIRMTREYKPARSHADATAEIVLGSGTQFDPRVVDAFRDRQDEFRQVFSRLAEEGTLEPQMTETGCGPPGCDSCLSKMETFR